MPASSASWPTACRTCKRRSTSVANSSSKATRWASCAAVTDEEYAALYQIARDFCDRGDFRHALPVALQLALHGPANYRYPFIAGACLQRLGQPEPAALMYALACDVNPDDAASAYRLGECLIAASRPDEAKPFLHKAVDLSYGKFHCRELQERARKKLEALH